MDDKFWLAVAFLTMGLFTMCILMSIGNQLERIANAVEIYNTYVQNQLMQPTRGVA